jgi:hypothetical protein
MTRRPYEVRIDRLVLPPGAVGAAQIRAAVEREVARALRESGPGKDTHRVSLDVRLEGAGDAKSIGRAVAKAATKPPR